jgi:hypothetical protein
MATSSSSITQELDRIAAKLEARGRVFGGGSSNHDSDRVSQAIGRIADQQHEGCEPPDDHKQPSRTITEAIDRVRRAADRTVIEYPLLANPRCGVEQVLIFNSDDKIFLNADDPNLPFFHSTGEGILTDINGKQLEGSRGLSSLPITNPEELDEALLWPNPQQEPYNRPPVDPAHTTGIGFAKNFISFGDEEDSSLSTVGPSLAKILRLRGGGAQFWESSVQAVCDATGRYAGARGMLVFAGSAHFDDWPETREGQLARLTQGFDARLVRCFKLVLKEDAA